MLTAEQEAAVRLIESGRNVFLTGVAGTGKSFTLNSWLERTKKRVAVTASTGIAATHIGGQTIHSFLGAGRCDKPVERVVNSHYFREKLQDEIMQTAVLCLDEVSMVSARDFKLFSDICCYVRGSQKPFGGMQLVFVGDMGQLAPVQKRQSDDYEDPIDIDPEAGRYCFTSKEWWDADIQAVELRQVHRQEEAEFATLLRRIRGGKIEDGDYGLLLRRVCAFNPSVAPEAVRIMTHNDMVDAINARKLAVLPGRDAVFIAKDSGPERGLKALDKDCLSPRYLRLKEGARVMFTRNSPEREYANGTLGTVVHVERPCESEDVDFDDFDEDADVEPSTAPESENAIRVQLDNGRLVTVKKAEWSLECGHEDIEVPVEQPPKEGTPEYESLSTQEQADSDQYYFLLERGEVIEPMQTIRKAVKATRVQYPLRLAWGITVHRSQGATFSRASINIENCFDPGQAYVALSRVKTLDGLNIESKFPKKAIKTDWEVIRFLRYMQAQAAERGRSTTAVPS